MTPYNPHSEDQRRAAATRSYVTPAVITLVLYFVLWLPGLIANIVYWVAANSDHRLTGQEPQGKGCLLALFACFVGLPLAGVALFVLGALFLAVLAGVLGAVSSP